MRKASLVFSLFMLLVFSISAKNNITITKRITFGGGGGITGEVVAYELTPDGILMRDGVRIAKKCKCETKPIFVQADDCLRLPVVMEPGNTYNFIKIETADSSYYTSWQFEDQITDQQAYFYYELQKLVPNGK